MINKLFIIFFVVVSSFLVPEGIELYQDYKGYNAVVKITHKSNPRSGGTGFSLRLRSGRIITVTNSHICKMAKEDNTLLATQGEHSQEIEIIYDKPSRDLCALTYYSKALPLVIADSAYRHQKIAVYGHPRLRPLRRVAGRIVASVNVKLLEYYLKTKDGICKAGTDKEVIPSWLFGDRYACIGSYPGEEISAAIQSGNSGSPVVNQFGSVVGVVFAGIRGQPLGFMVPHQELVIFLSKVEKILSQDLD